MNKKFAFFFFFAGGASKQLPLKLIKRLGRSPLLSTEPALPLKPQNLIFIAGHPKIMRPGAMLQLCSPSAPKWCCLPSCSASREPFAEVLWCFLPILWIPPYPRMKSNGCPMPAWATTQHINSVSRCLQGAQTQHGKQNLLGLLHCPSFAVHKESWKIQGKLLFQVENCQSASCCPCISCTIRLPDRSTSPWYFN